MSSRYVDPFLFREQEPTLEDQKSVYRATCQRKNWYFAAGPRWATSCL